MSEEVLGSIGVSRASNMGYVIVSEVLYFTQDRTVVARTSSGKGRLLSYFAVIIGAVIGGSLIRGIAGWNVGVIGGAILGGILGAIFGGIAEVIIIRLLKKRENEYSKLSIEDVLKANKYNYAIPNSDITEVEVMKVGRGAKLIVKRSKQNARTEWIGVAWKDVEEKYENMLRPIFKDRLIVKK